MIDRSAVVIVMIVIITTSTFGMPFATDRGQALASPFNSDADQSTAAVANIPGDQILNATAEVKIWERSILPVRADSGAAISVDNAAWDVKLEGTGEKTLNKQDIAYYEINKEISLSYNDQRADEDLSDENVQVVAARLVGGRSHTLSGISTHEELASLLTDQNTNTNASFEFINDDTSLDSSGDLSFTYNPTQPGQYIIFVSTRKNGSLGISNNDIKVSGDNVTVIGYLGLSVRRSGPSVSPKTDTYDAGKYANFSVNTSTAINEPAGENVSHAILLYDNATYRSETFKLVADGHLTRNFDLSKNLTLNHSIQSVNGTKRSVNSPSAYGLETGKGVIESSNTLESVVNFLGQNSSLSDSIPPKTTTTGSTVLDASMTVVNGSSTENIAVKTHSGWRSGCYRWIYMAKNESGTEFTAEAGTVGIGTNCGSDGSDAANGDGGGGGGGGGGGAPPPPSPTGLSIDATTVGSDIHQISVSRANANEWVNFTLPPFNRTQPFNGTISGVAVRTTQDGNFGITVKTSENPPGDLTDLETTGRGVGLTYFDIGATVNDNRFSQVVFDVTVNKSTVSQAGLPPQNVTFYRYSNGTWAPRATTLVNETNSSYIFRTQSPGFSKWAIGIRGIPQGEKLQIETATIERSTISGENTFTATATVQNPSEINQTGTFDLAADTTVLDSQRVTVPPGESRKLTFNSSIREPGTYRITIGDRAAGELTIREPTPDTPTVQTPPTQSTATPISPETPVGQQAGSPAAPNGDGTPADGSGGINLWLVAIVLVVLFIIGYFGSGPILERMER